MVRPLQMLHPLVRVQLMIRSTCHRQYNEHCPENPTRSTYICTVCVVICIRLFCTVYIVSSASSLLIPLPLPHTPTSTHPHIHTHTPTHTHTHTVPAAKCKTQMVACTSLWLIRGDHLLLRKKQCCHACQFCALIKLAPAVQDVVVVAVPASMSFSFCFSVHTDYAYNT